MKSPSILTFTISLILTVFLACAENASQPISIRDAEPLIPASSILKNWKTFAYYQSDYMPLKGKFHAYDSNYNEISKDQCLRLYSTGAYLPLRLNLRNDSIYYKMIRMDDSVPGNLRYQIGLLGQRYYQNFKREGTRFPRFNFEDMEGTVYNNENMKGKTLVVKCWFIHCQACIAEFPELNKMVNKYKGRDDIIFLSMAFDSKAQLRNFLQKRGFSYKVLPVPETYISDTLGVSIYPTHFIVDGKGIIRMVSSNAHEIEVALEEGLNDELSHQ
ncbi:hypothetical protein COR50_08095 [Chitinophaga caeni]|uniref:Thioredoxin domain-containing protein n=1 Tax=Chitinophaga caeni TaxID=2029983 RepID=A0A291QT91_9BACT|nr:TlpA disulfide reductase family protein [Chitinophaga caeni]ATL47147.1 hypothetical protein COR50_08095 [Chitinophaga caeni]